MDACNRNILCIGITEDDGFAINSHYQSTSQNAQVSDISQDTSSAIYVKGACSGACFWNLDIHAQLIFFIPIVFNLQLLNFNLQTSFFSFQN
jgi:hypothetical protein